LSIAGKTFWVLGDIYTIKITGKETQSKYAVAEIEVAPQNGPPLHKHSLEDEGFYVLDGQFSFPYGQSETKGSAGTYAYAPRGQFHTYRNTGSTSGRLLVVITPAGFEKFFEEIGVQIKDRESFQPPTTPPDLNKILEASKRYGLEIKT
jgi:quercetin dioxygenase-like cupin family protein